MEVKNYKISDIKPYENNPRNNDDAVPYVAASIRDFGFQQPIVIDKDNIIIAGHTRYKAAIQLGMDEVPCVKADELTDEQIKAYRLVDNKTAELASWDYSMLDTELKDVSEDMEQYGFIPNSEVNLDDFFEEKSAEDTCEEKAHSITCPHCGETVEISDKFEVLQ